MQVFRNLFNRLLGKGAAPTTDAEDPELRKRNEEPAERRLEQVRNNRPPKPKVISDPNSDSPFIMVQNEGGVATLMDREHFDYLYGESKGPDPAQRDLDELLPKVTRVRAIASGMFRGKAMGTEVVLETTEPAAVAALRRAFKIVGDPNTFAHCACLGGPTLELYRGQDLLATIGLQHGHSIRWAKWKHDARLVHGQDLNDWLIGHGIEPSLLALLLHNQYDAGGMMSVGLQRRGPRPLSRSEQRLRLVELTRVRGGDLNSALAECQKVLDAEPNLAFGYAVRALVHAQRGDHARCLADCTEAIHRDLRDAEIFFARAVAADNLGRPREALADCTTAIQIDPEHANAHNSRGLIRMRLEKADEALPDFAEAIRLVPEWFLPYLNRAQLYHGRAQLDAALADYDRAIDQLKKAPPAQSPPTGDPTLAIVHCRRGEARYDHFREAEAEEDFAEARRRNAEAAAGYLGDMWLRRSQFDKALETFSELVRLRPKESYGYVRRGTAREALGDLDQALADYSAAIRLQPSEGPAYALRAQVYQRQGRLDDAISDLTQYLRIHPEDPIAYLNRATVHEHRGELEEAMNDRSAAHRAAPDHPLVCNSLAWMIATCSVERFRDGQRAVELARQACEATEWNNHYCLDTLGAACAEAGSFDEAVRWQAKAVELCPEDLKEAKRVRLQKYQAGQPHREERSSSPGRAEL